MVIVVVTGSGDEEEEEEERMHGGSSDDEEANGGGSDATGIGLVFFRSDVKWLSQQQQKCTIGAQKMTTRR